METPTRSGSIKLRWLYVVVAIVGALGSAFWVERARDARMKTLERELRRLSEERSTERATTSERHGSPAIVPRTPVHDLAQAPAAPAEVETDEARVSEPQPSPSLEDQAAYLDSVYSQQAYDASWARTAQAGLSAGITARLGTSSLESLECRESICKARLSHRDQAEFSGFIDRLLENANTLWTGAIQSYRDPVGRDGIVTNAIYFARGDAELPHL